MVEARTSPAQAYSTLRMRKARTLVLQTKASFVDIAYDVGFNNASHFSRAFRRLYGIFESQSHGAATREWFFNSCAEGDVYVQRLTSNVGSVNLRAQVL
nr:helix-turn-helix domain-containing protein [Rhizobium leguminosarum]